MIREAYPLVDETTFRRVLHYLRICASACELLVPFDHLANFTDAPTSKKSARTKEDRKVTVADPDEENSSGPAEETSGDTAVEGNDENSSLKVNKEGDTDQYHENGLGSLLLHTLLCGNLLLNISICLLKY